MAKTREELLEYYRNNRRGHDRKELCRFLDKWGFEPEEGKCHTNYSHPEYPDLYVSVTRSSGEISASYFKDAVMNIDELVKRQKDADNAKGERQR